MKPSGVVLVVCAVVFSQPAHAFVPAGDPDLSFGSSGVTIISLPPTAYGYTTALVGQPDGRLVTAGWYVVPQSGSSNQDYWAVTRYQTDGTLDAAFGSGGTVTTIIPNSNYHLANTALLQSDGQLVVGGESDSQGTFPDSTLVRYNPDGSLDPSFGNAGVTITPTIGGQHNDGLYAVLQQPDGKLVAAGYAHVGANGVGDECAIVRYHLDGTLDAAFGNSGIVREDAGQTDVRIRALALQPDGKLVAAGKYDRLLTPPEVIQQWENGFILLRFNADGSVDPSFGDSGAVKTTFGYGVLKNGGSIRAMVLQPDGKIVAAGSIHNADNVGLDEFGLLRYNTDGTLDPSFGIGGISFTRTPTLPAATRALALLPDGRFLAAGGEYVFTLARYNSNGSLDWTFGNNGVVSSAVNGEATGLVVQADGNIVVSGDQVSVSEIARFIAGTCGNSIVEVGEECDDGNLDNGDACDSNCTFPKCGNGVAGPGEQCDDGNNSNGDACDINCTPPGCGNSIVDPGEECDDGNTVDADGCSATCRYDLIPGGGPPSTDCLIEWSVANPTNVKGPRATFQKCRDNDPTCDFDGGVIGSCTFHVGLCIDVVDPTLPRCGGDQLASYEVAKPSAKDAARSPVAAAIRTDVANAINRIRTVGGCSAVPNVTVPLAPRGRRGHRRLRALVTGVYTGKRDTDTLMFTCLP